VSAPIRGLGPLERWLDDDDVTEVLVNAGVEIWIERRGAARGAEYVGRLPPGAVDLVLEHALSPVGRRIDRASPIVDARLADGSRMCAVLPPVSLDGPCLAVRKFSRRPIGLESFAPPGVVELLRELVHRRCNIVVSGATSSGKTTLLNALAAHVGTDERIITLEDTAELALGSAHVLRLETRPATPEGVAAVTMTDIVRAALRLRPDRLVVGEIRGDEATDLVQAMNTGHDGSLATVHANGADDALARIESLVVRANPGWLLGAVRDQVHRSVDVVVHVTRTSAGGRAVSHVAEVLPGDGAGRTVPLADASGVTGRLSRSRR
jgi:pilus assembly protein CpaF